MTTNHGAQEGSDSDSTVHEEAFANNGLVQSFPLTALGTEYDDDYIRIVFESDGTSIALTNDGYDNNWHRPNRTDNWSTRGRMTAEARTLRYGEPAAIITVPANSTVKREDLKNLLGFERRASIPRKRRDADDQEVLPLGEMRIQLRSGSRTGGSMEVAGSKYQANLSTASAKRLRKCHPDEDSVAKASFVIRAANSDKQTRFDIFKVSHT